MSAASADRTDRDVGQTFRDALGRDPDGVFSAPGRVNLIGEHTDHNEGHVLPFAIDRRCRVAAAARADGTVTVRSTQEPDDLVTTTLDALAQARGWSAYALGTVWALREEGLPGAGWDLVVDGDVPLGAGLSSSAALESAVALAVAELTGSDLDRHTLARAGRRAENDIVGAPVGIMDQAASLMCREGAALLLDCRTLEAEHVALGLEEHGLVTLVVDTRVRHDLADGGYADRRAACVAAAEALGVDALREATPAMLDRLDGTLLRRARHVVTEQARVHRVVELLRAGRPAEVGPELTASHASLRDDFEVSVPALDAVVETALEHGALGSRLVGGGFGGSALLLTPAAAAEDIAEAVTRRAAVDGHPEPVVREVHPAGGARRER
ncbi:galactokinase [Actinomycetospora callitridis]|uniref:galactokinase n=1 Tax=Actinomycetospora callitridis TaxID=913944 RepID=UPI0023668A38|nr:galactokinase [Actinomycetospora callitridis]MDD7918953.1 galactokinase [Actinomycetospora callitridis]